MNCWKTINLMKDYGAVRIILTAVCFMILVFISTFLAFELLRPGTSLSDEYVSLFGGLLVVILFVHKVIHVLPIICKKKKNRKKVLHIAHAHMETYTKNNNADFTRQPVLADYTGIVLRSTGISESRSLFLHDLGHSRRLLSA